MPLSIPKSRNSIKPNRPFRINPASPQLRGLERWWTFSGFSSGRVLDDHFDFTAFQGIFQGNPLWEFRLGVGWTHRFFGAALDRFDIQNIISLGTRSFSVTAILSVSSWQGFGGVINIRNAGGANEGFVLYTDNTPNRFAATIDYGATEQSVNGSSKADDPDILYVVVVTVDRGGLMSLYVNGELEATVDISANSGSNIDSTDLPLIGRDPVFVNNFEGRIADVRVINRPILPPEVFAMFQPTTRWDLFLPLPFQGSHAELPPVLPIRRVHPYSPPHHWGLP